MATQKDMIPYLELSEIVYSIPHDNPESNEILIKYRYSLNIPSSEDLLKLISSKKDKDNGIDREVDILFRYAKREDPYFFDEKNKNHNDLKYNDFESDNEVSLYSDLIYKLIDYYSNRFEDILDKAYLKSPVSDVNNYDNFDIQKIDIPISALSNITKRIHYAPVFENGDSKNSFFSNKIFLAELIEKELKSNQIEAEVSETYKLDGTFEITVCDYDIQRVRNLHRKLTDESNFKTPIKIPDYMSSDLNLIKSLLGLDKA